MSLTIHPDLESRIRSQAEAEGLTVDAYLERLIRARQTAIEEIESIAMEGLNSGEPIEPSSEYWDQKHHLLDEQLKNRSCSGGH